MMELKGEPKQSKFEWSSNMTFQLIKMYHNFPALWNPNHEQYNTRTIRDTAIDNMAAKFGTTVEEIKRKIHNLRNQYNQVEIRSRKLQGSGREFRSKWIYFEEMKFLRSYIVSTPSNVGIISFSYYCNL